MKTEYTDNQLKQALAKMLPTEIGMADLLAWKVNSQHYGRYVLDTELLHICWLIEQSIPSSAFSTALMRVIQDETCWPAVDSRYATASASWHLRTIALAKVKGVEIV